MFLSATIHPESAYAHVLDAKTGAEIKDVNWCDDETGMFGKFRVDAAGKPVLDARGEAVIDVFVRPIRLVFDRTFGHG